MTTGNETSVVEGTFMLPRGASNVVVYQGFGYASASADPIVLCQSQPD